jgi:hypothetical protein
MGCEYNQYVTREGGEAYMGLISARMTLIFTAFLVCGNLLLVLVTKNYADETKKMVDYYYESWEAELKPLLVPIGQEVIDQFDVWNLFIENLGGIALLIHVEIVEFNYYKSFPVITHLGKETIEVPNLTKKLLQYGLKNPEQSESIRLTINIRFQDKTTHKYIQTINFIFTRKKWEYTFDDSFLPKSIN